MLAQLPVALSAMIAIFTCFQGAFALRDEVDGFENRMQDVCVMKEKSVDSPLELSVVVPSCSDKKNCNFFQLSQDGSKLLPKFLQTEEKQVGSTSKCMCHVKSPSEEAQPCSTFKSPTNCPISYCTWTGEEKCEARELVRYLATEAEPCSERGCWRKYSDFFFSLRTLLEGKEASGVDMSVMSGNHWNFSCQSGDSTSTHVVKSVGDLLDEIKEQPSKLSAAKKSLWKKVILPKKFTTRHRPKKADQTDAPEPAVDPAIPAVVPPATKTPEADQTDAPEPAVDPTIPAVVPPATTTPEADQTDAPEPAVDPAIPAVVPPATTTPEEQAEPSPITIVLQSLSDALELQSSLLSDFKRLQDDAKELMKKLHATESLGAEKLTESTLSNATEVIDRIMPALEKAINNLSSNCALVTAFDTLTDLNNVDEALYADQLADIVEAIQEQERTLIKLGNMGADVKLLEENVQNQAHANVSTARSSTGDTHLPTPASASGSTANSSTDQQEESASTGPWYAKARDQAEAWRKKMLPRLNQYNPWRKAEQEEKDEDFAEEKDGEDFAEEKDGEDFAGRQYDGEFQDALARAGTFEGNLQGLIWFYGDSAEIIKGVRKRLSVVDNPV